MSTDMTLAEFLDRCCRRYAKEPSYRRTLQLEQERPFETRKNHRRPASAGGSRTT